MKVIKNRTNFIGSITAWNSKALSMFVQGCDQSNPDKKFSTLLAGNLIKTSPITFTSFPTSLFIKQLPAGSVGCLEILPITFRLKDVGICWKRGSCHGVERMREARRRRIHVNTRLIFHEIEFDGNFKTITHFPRNFLSCTCNCPGAVVIYFLSLNYLHIVLVSGPPQRAGLKRNFYD